MPSTDNIILSESTAAQRGTPSDDAGQAIDDHRVLLYDAHGVPVETSRAEALSERDTYPSITRSAAGRAGPSRHTGTGMSRFLTGNAWTLVMLGAAAGWLALRMRAARSRRAPATRISVRRHRAPLDRLPHAGGEHLQTSA